MFQMALLLLEDNNCAKLLWNPCKNVQVMAWTSSIYDHFDLYLTPVTLTFNLTKKMFQMALFLLKGNNCAKLFWNPCIIVQVMVRTNPDRCTHTRQTKIVTTMSRLPASGLDNKKNYLWIILNTSTYLELQGHYGEWIKCVTCIHIRIPTMGIYESLKILRGSITNTIKALKYLDIWFKSSNQFWNYLKCYENCKHKKLFLN